MRSHIYSVFKNYFRSVLLETRATLGITQEQMAARLLMSRATTPVWKAENPAAAP